MKKSLFLMSLIAMTVMTTGCATVAEKTNMLTDDQIKSQTAGVLGYHASDLSVTSRRTEGVNTYVNLIAVNKKEYTCMINGGNFLSMGMTNPPSCAKKGDPISVGPLQK